MFMTGGHVILEVSERTFCVRVMELEMVLLSAK